jgi:hypothetical protein
MIGTQLLKNCQIDYVGALITAASSTDGNSTRLDMAGFDGVMFFTTITDCVSGGVATLKVEENTSDADSGMTLITGASAAATSAGNDDLNGMLLIVDVYRPRERYVQGVRVSATQNIAFGEIHAIRYKSRKGPITQSATTVAASTFVVGS